ncbi:MAG: HEAT repeat domain-containing protein [Lentisphaerae bacterium]|nr:HEAT repeat domain-containing protein [Lentisphaerota bacterium]
MTPLSTIYCSLAVFFPLWMQIWQSEPISSADFDRGSHYQIEPETLDKVREGLRLCAPDLRCRLLLELSEAQIPATQSLLLDWLQQEPLPELQATILSYLGKTDLAGIEPARIQPYLASKHLQTQENAIALYGQIPQADFSALLPYLQAELDGSVLPLKIRRAAWRCFAAKGALAAKTLTNAALLAFKDDPSIEVQALALQTAAYIEPRSRQISNWLDQAAKSDKALLRLAAAKDPRPESAERLQMLLEDREVTVRAAACAANQGSHQELLLQSLKDPNAAVRLAAVIALRRQSSLNNETAILALLDSCRDPYSELIRDESETSLFLCAQNQAGPAKELLKEALIHEDSLIRLHATRILVKLNESSAMPIIAANLAKESNSENLVAAVQALTQMSQPGSHAALLQSYVEHPSPLLRAAVAVAVGTLRTDNAEAILEKLCLDPDSDEVRAAAFQGMGLFPKGSFAASILKCLKNTSKTSSKERRNAAWACGKLMPENSAQEKKLVELAQRLLLQCTVPVIPGMEPMFEEIDVIANAMYSLVQLQKRFPQYNEFGELSEKVLAVYGVPWEEAANIGGASQSMPPPVDASTNSLVNQARQWLQGEQASTEAIPPSSLGFIYQKYNE